MNDNQLSTGVELWNKVDTLFNHVQQGLNEFETIYKIFTDLHKAHLSTAKKYRTIHSNYHPKAPKGKDAEIPTPPYTSTASLHKILCHISQCGTENDVTANSINIELIQKAGKNITQWRSELNSKKTAYNKLVSAMEDKKSGIDRLWVKYNAAYREYTKATEIFERLKADPNTPRNQISQAQKIMEDKEHSFTYESLTEWFKEVGNYNNYQTQFLLKDVLAICGELEILDELRHQETKLFFKQLTEIQKQAGANIIQMAEKIEDSASAIDFASDLATLISTNRDHGLEMPSDVHNIDLQKNPDLNVLNFYNNSNNKRKEGTKTYFIGQGFRPMKIQEYTGEQLYTRLLELQRYTESLEKELEATKKLRETYVNDPDNYRKTSQPFDACQRKLNSLNIIIDRYQKDVSPPNNASAAAATSLASAKGATEIGYPVSSDKFVDDDNNFDDDPQYVDDENNLDDEYEVIGKAEVLYDFVVDNNGDPQMLSITAGELLLLLRDDDDGVGWIKAKRLNGPEIGFVPEDYIQKILD